MAQYNDNEQHRPSHPALGNAVKPDGMTLEQWQCALRRQQARREKLTVQAVDERLSPGEYQVENPATARRYKVVYRGDESPWNYCSCMDFRTSQLGTCKHIEAVRLQLEREGRMPYWFTPAYTSVYLSYRHGRQVAIRVGTDQCDAFEALAAEYFTPDGVLRDDAYDRFDNFLTRARAIDPDFRCYPDALQYVLDRREAFRRRQLVERSGTLDNLLREPLYPYQVEGIRFAASAGRAILADEMGLGKTVQAIGTAQLLHRLGVVQGILVVCPTSLLHQWHDEVQRFTGLEALVVEGPQPRRLQLYRRAEMYKIVSYTAMANDIRALGGLTVDMVVMDEVQRLKNWDTQIARAARRIESPYALLLSGTPLQDRLEELYSIVELVDQYCLSPYYRFRHRHFATDRAGRLTGYQHLDEVAARLQPLMLRRRKRDVALQLPERIDQTLTIPLTPQQRALHDQARAHTADLVRKWQHMHALAEPDRRLLMQHIQHMCMAADSTALIDPQTRHSNKLSELLDLLDDILASGDGKIVVFTAWQRMARQVAAALDQRGTTYRYLHGDVPSAKRPELVRDFNTDAGCRIFLSTDAGSTGLNLQAATVLVNLDIPSSPAVMQQRVARVHRMGQSRGVQIINMVSAGTFEQFIHLHLHTRQTLADNLLDPEAVDTVFATADRLDSLLATLAEYLQQPVLEHEADPEAAKPERKPQHAQFIHEDPATGQVYLAIPFPDRAAAEHALQLMLRSC